VLLAYANAGDADGAFHLLRHFETRARDECPNAKPDECSYNPTTLTLTLTLSLALTLTLALALALALTVTVTLTLPLTANPNR